MPLCLQADPVIVTVTLLHELHPTHGGFGVISLQLIYHQSFEEKNILWKHCLPSFCNLNFSNTNHSNSLLPFLYNRIYIPAHNPRNETSLMNTKSVREEELATEQNKI